MARDWLKKPQKAESSLSELIAAKDYPNAIELLRAQLKKRPGMQTRLQLADLLLLAGRRDEAMTIFTGLADELAKDGFVAKAVAILKRIDRLEPGRADIEQRLAQLASQPVRERAVAASIMPVPVAKPAEIGIEEVREAAREEKAAPPPTPTPIPTPAPEVVEEKPAPPEPVATTPAVEPVEAAEIVAPATGAEKIEPPPAEPKPEVETRDVQAPAPATDATEPSPAAEPAPSDSASAPPAEAVDSAATEAPPAVPMSAPKPVEEKMIGGLSAIWKRLLTALPGARADVVDGSAATAPAVAPTPTPTEGEGAATPPADAAVATSAEPGDGAVVAAEGEKDASPPEATAEAPVTPPSEDAAAADGPPSLEAAPSTPTAAEAPASEAAKEPSVPAEPAEAQKEKEKEEEEKKEEVAPASALPPPIEGPADATVEATADAPEPVAPPPTETPVEAAPAEAETPASVPEPKAEPEPEVTAGPEVVASEPAPAPTPPETPTEAPEPAPAAEATPAEADAPTAATEPSIEPSIEIEVEATVSSADAPEPERIDPAPEATTEAPVATVAAAESAPSADSPAPAAPADGEASPAVVEKLGGVFKKFLAALPAGEARPVDEDGSYDPAKDLADALAAAGIDPDSDEAVDQAFLDSFIDDDELEAAVEPQIEPEPAPVASVPVVTVPKWTSPMSEAGFRDQVLDLIEEVLKRPPEVGPAAPGENTEPIASAYRDELLAHPLFRDLSEEAMLAVLHALRLVCCEAGEIVVTEGEPGGSLFLLISGMVKLFVRNPVGHNILVGRLTEGSFFGEMSLLSGRPRNATLTAADRVELLELPKPLLDAIAHAHPHVRDVIDELYLQRASSPEVAAARSIRTGDAQTREHATRILTAYFGGRRWEPRMQLKLATVLLKSGKEEEAVPVLVDLADTMLREGDAAKAITILKKVELIRRRSLKEVNLAPLSRTDAERPNAAGATKAGPPTPAWMGRTEGFFGDWLGTFRRSLTPSDAAPRRTLPGYGPGLVASPLFDGFSEEELLAFMQGLRLMVFEPGDVIVTEGEPGQSVFILSTGTVKVFVRNPRGHDIELCELNEGAFFGEMSALSGRPRTATVTAGARCELLELDRPALEAIAETHPRIRQVLEEHYIERASSPDAERIRTAGPPS